MCASVCRYVALSVLCGYKTGLHTCALPVCLLGAYIWFCESVCVHVCYFYFYHLFIYLLFFSEWSFSM